MSQEKVEQWTLDVAELTRLMESTTRPKVKDVLSIQLRKWQTDITMEKDKMVAEPVKKSDASTNTKANSYDVQVKTFSWDQSDKFVKIYLTSLNNVQSLPEDNVVKEFSPKSVTVRVNELAGKNHVFSIKETGEHIDPEKSYVKIKTDMVSIFLKKATEGQKWEHLRAVEKAQAEAKKKEDFKANKDEDPSAGIMNLMKKMYEEGDDNMKRTIAEAMTKSRNPTDSI